MDQQENKTRQLIAAPADIVIRRLPALGNLMIIGKANGATHERIGTVEKIENVDGWLTATGEHHDSRMDPSLVCRIVLDTSSVMQNQVYPRLDFQDGEGNTLFAFVGFAGEEPFEKAVADLTRTVLEPVPANRPQRPEVAEDDAGAVPLKAALNAAQAITISFESTGFSQKWSGVVEKVSPGMGFINIMRPDFHLHLLGGTVGTWRTDEAVDATRLVALDFDGKETGLVLTAADAGIFTSGDPT